MPLTRKQELQCAKLLRQAEFPTKTQQLFEAFLLVGITSAFELAVLRPMKGSLLPEILLIYRNDKHFKGWHMPGTMILGKDTMEIAEGRLVEQEVDLPLEIPRFVRYFFVPKGTGDGENPRGAEIGFLHLAYVLRGVRTKPRCGKFFPIESIPKNTLRHHVKMIAELRARLRLSQYEK